MSELKGQCMCGAVTIAATRADPIVRACHCDMCRRWTSSMYMSVPTTPGSISVSGPVKKYSSSDWAERAFCDTCGSALWYATVHDDHKNLAAGLCDNPTEADEKRLVGFDWVLSTRPAGENYDAQSGDTKMTKFRSNRGKCGCEIRDA